MMEEMKMELMNETKKTNEEVEKERGTKELNEPTDQQIVDEIEEEKKPEHGITETSTSMTEIIHQPYGLKKEKSEDSIEPNCCYWECCTNEFCDKCSRKCDGRIKAKGHRAQTMDQSKMCLKLGGDPDVYYITKKESEKLLSGDKVAYLEIKIDPRVIKDSIVKVFFGVKND